MTADAGPQPPRGYAIRRRNAGDDGALVAIENRANRLLVEYGYRALETRALADVGALRGMIGAGDVFVAVTAEDVPAGFAVAERRGRRLHLRELSVDPAHGRRGLGAALVRAVVAHARSLGLSGVSLTTFRSVPFNGPFYTRLGFAELATHEAGHELADALRDETPAGTPAADRAIMALDFGAPPFR